MPRGEGSTIYYQGGTNKPTSAISFVPFEPFFQTCRLVETCGRSYRNDGHLTHDT